MSKVKIVASQEGVVVRPNENKKDWGFIRVQQTVVTLEGGFRRENKRSALITGKLAELMSDGYRDGQELKGQIIVKESTTPFNAENPDSDLKVAGESGVPCTIGGMPIYRKSEFTSNMDAHDTLIAHDNGDAIKEVQATLGEA